MKKTERFFRGFFPAMIVILVCSLVYVTGVIIVPVLSIVLPLEESILLAFNPSEGVAVLVGGFIAATATIGITLTEYRRSVRQSSSSAALHLVNEIIGISDEIAYSVRYIKNVMNVDTESWVWGGLLVERDSFKKSIGDLESLIQKKRKFSSLQNTFKSSFDSISSFKGGKTSGGSVTSEEHKIKNGEIIYNALKHCGDSESGKIIPIKLFSNRSAYEQAMPTLRTLSDDRTWAEAIFSLGRFYEECDLAETIYQRLATTCTIDLDEVGSEGSRKKYYIEIDNLFTQYWLKLIEINLYHTPLSILRLFIAYGRSIEDVPVTGFAYNRIRIYHEKFHEILKSFEDVRLRQLNLPGESPSGD